MVELKKNKSEDVFKEVKNLFKDFVINVGILKGSLAECRKMK